MKRLLIIALFFSVAASAQVKTMSGPTVTLTMPSGADSLVLKFGSTILQKSYPGVSRFIGRAVFSDETVGAFSNTARVNIDGAIAGSPYLLQITSRATSTGHLMMINTSADGNAGVYARFQNNSGTIGGQFVLSSTAATIPNMFLLDAVTGPMMLRSSTGGFYINPSSLGDTSAVSWRMLRNGKIVSGTWVVPGPNTIFTVNGVAHVRDTLKYTASAVLSGSTSDSVLARDASGNIVTTKRVSDYSGGGGSGTVTSVATSAATGITGGTITATGTIAADTLLLSTRKWRQKGIDSLAALISSGGGGTVTNVATDATTGIAGGPFTNTGTISADTVLLATRKWRQKGIDSLNAIIATKGVGSVTSVATSAATGITGGTITGSGTIAADTVLLATRLWRQKGIDSINALLAGKAAALSLTTNYIPKATSSTAIGNSVMYESSSKIGIGTTSPGATIHTLEANTDGGLAFRFENSSAASSGTKYVTIGQVGSNGYGITDWPNTGLIEGTANGGMTLGAYIGNINFQIARTSVGKFFSTGNFYLLNSMGIGQTSPTARLHLPAGTATANTAPLKFTTGTALTTPADGAMEYHGSHLYFTIGSTRYQLDQQSGSSLTMGTINSQTKAANGAVITGGTLVLQTATGALPGLMSAADKARLDSNSYITTPVTGTQVGFRVDDSTFRVKSLVAGAGIALTANGDTTITVSIPTTTSTWGTYTTTATGVLNITAVTPQVWQYSRTGNTVTVSGTITIQPTSAGGANTTFRCTLPIASAIANSTECGGTVICSKQGGSITGDVTNDAAFFALEAAVSTSLTYSVIFMYQVL